MIVGLLTPLRPGSRQIIPSPGVMRVQVAQLKTQSTLWPPHRQVSGQQAMSNPPVKANSLLPTTIVGQGGLSICPPHKASITATTSTELRQALPATHGL